MAPESSDGGVTWTFAHAAPSQRSASAGRTDGLTKLSSTPTAQASVAETAVVPSNQYSWFLIFGVGTTWNVPSHVMDGRMARPTPAGAPAAAAAGVSTARTASIA